MKKVLEKIIGKQEKRLVKLFNTDPEEYQDQIDLVETLKKIYYFFYK